MRRALVAFTILIALTVPALTDAQVPSFGHVPLAPNVPSPPQILAPSDEVVTIVRDAFGVPHVYADSLYALGFGNGYVQAQDRLFQLDVLRHVGKADAAAILGPSLLPMDLELRRELYTDVERQATYEALPADGKELFDGYAAGVNRFLVEALADPLKMPAEFGAVDHVPEPWTVPDTIAIAQFLLDRFGSGGGDELSNAQLLAHLRTTVGEAEAEAAFNDLAWVKDATTPPSIPPEEGAFAHPEFAHDLDAIPDVQKEVAAAAADAVPFGAGESLLSVVPDTLPVRFGSNAVLVAPSLSRSGGGLLGGGPQMGYFSPMIPYEVGLHGAGFDVAGIGVGGAPGVVIGRTANFAWTVTSGISDQVDVVAVELVEDTPRAYFFNGDVKYMDCRTEYHLVKAPPPTGPSGIPPPPPDVLEQEVCRTLHGPVFAINEDAGWAFARERSHRTHEIESGLRWLGIGRTTDLDGFRAQLADFAFTFNFHYVDAQHAYFQHVGYQPVRHPALDPRLPRPGTGAFEWQAIQTGETLPHSLNPARGWIVNWNNLPQQGWSSGDGRELWGPVHRVQLLEDRLEAALSSSPDGTLDQSDVEEVVREAATRDPFARATVPHLLSAIDAWGDATLGKVRGAVEAWAVDDYRWAADGDGTYLPGHAIYDAWRAELQERLFRDRLGPFMRPINFDPPTSDDPHGGDHAQHGTKDAVLMRALDGTAAHAWCDDLTTDAVEACPARLLEALRAALHQLEVEFGTPNVAEWRMAEHRIRFVALSASPAFEFPMVNRASFNHFHDFGTAGSPTSKSVLPPGAGAGYWPPAYLANFLGTGTLPPHARDQLDLYVAWDYKPFAFARAQAEAGGTVETHHTLLPTQLLQAPPVP